MLVTGTYWIDGNSNATLAPNAISKTGTTLALTTSRTAPVGSFIVVTIATDNSQTTNGAATQISGVTDSAGNTYSRAYEYCNSRGAAQGGAEIAVFTATVTTQLGSGGTITVTNANSAYARSAYAYVWSPASPNAGATLAVGGSTYAAGTGGLPAANISLSGLTRRNYLYLCLGAFETSTIVNFVQSAPDPGNYVPPVTWWDYRGSQGPACTSGGGGASNMGLWEGLHAPISYSDFPQQPVLGTTGATCAIRDILNVPTVDQVWTLGAFYVDGSNALRKAHGIASMQRALMGRR